MDATTETISVERTISIAATPETVWEFFVDPEKLTRWKGIPRLEIVATGGDPGEDPWLTQDMQAS